MCTTSPVTRSVNDVCVITLLRVIVDVTVALCAIGGAAAGNTRAGSASLGGGAEKRRPVADRRRHFTRIGSSETAVSQRDGAGVSKGLETAGSETS